MEQLKLDRRRALCDVVKSDGRNRFEAVTDEATDTFLEKNADYGNSFEMDLDDYDSVFPFLYESTKKIRRVKSLNKPGVVARVKESIRDNIMDIVVYGIMAIMWLDKKEEGK